MDLWVMAVKTSHAFSLLGDWFSFSIGTGSASWSLAAPPLVTVTNHLGRDEGGFDFLHFIRSLCSVRQILG